MLNLALHAVISLLVSILIGYNLCKIQLPKRLYDQPNKRKLHQIPTPKIGGFMILGSILVTTLLFGFWKNENYNYYLILCIGFFMIGFLDDIYNWNYKKKLLAQIFGVGLFLIIIPVDFSRIIFSSLDLQFPWINFILITMWIIGIINSFNFFDGINTLAGSLAVIFLASYGIMLYSN